MITHQSKASFPLDDEFLELNMVQKRPFDDEELYEISSKHPRQLEHNHHLISFLEFVPFDDPLQKPRVQGEGELLKSKTEGDEKLLSGFCTDFPISAKDTETFMRGCISTSSWATSSTSEDDARSEAPIDVSLFPEYFSSDSPVRASNDSDDYYLSLLDYPPRKSVPVGSDHQVDVPAWSQGIMDSLDYLEASEQVIFSPQASGLELSVGNIDEKRLIGTCVMPMPKSEPFCNDAAVGNGRTDCSCHDRGSVRCVRQHIVEAREKLRGTLGEERFVKLGLHDMGEEVAEKWNEEEEQLFHEVVFSNPVSLGKNFWDNLSLVFPSRTTREIVSYYFNVFMLRKRAEQNRYDPENIDSDNDEWPETDYCNDEHEMTEEDEDSVVESPIYQEDPSYNPCHADDKRKYGDIGDVTRGDNENVNYGSGMDILDISESCTDKFLNNSGSDSICQLSDVPWDGKGDHGIKDGSCTSSNTGADSQRTQAKAGNGDHWLGGHGYALEPCDAKVWDAGYVTCSKTKVDLLSTCSMIEEVFGAGTGTYKGADGQGLI